MSVNSNNSHCGIDFGTTNSSLAVSSSNVPTIIPIDDQNPDSSVLRSLIYINPQQETIVGHQAINRYLTDLSTLPAKPLRQELTGRIIKTFGPSTGSGVGPVIWVPEIVEVDDSGRGRLLQSLKSVLTSTVFTGTEIFGKFYTLEDLLTILLKQIKTRAETKIGRRLTSAVIGRPVRYVGQSADKVALDRMHQVALNAGFKHIEFEYEPIGAALNYGIDITTNQTVLVYDFGGGTLDVCVMKLPEKEVLAVAGIGVGGDLLNTRLVQSELLNQFGANAIISGKLTMSRHFYTVFNSWYQTTLQKTVRNLETLRHLALQSDQPKLIHNLISLIAHDYGFEFFQAIDQAKINLSTQNYHRFAFVRPHLSLQKQITRAHFEASIFQELQDSQDCIFQALRLASLRPSDIDKVILTGGSSQIPIFINQIKAIFSPPKIVTSNYFTAVATGLSLRAEEIFK